MAVFDKLLQLMADRNASDIYVSTGIPIHIKIEGVAMPVNQQVMDPPTIKAMAYEILTPEQISTLEKTKELNFSIGKAGIGNFRFNMFWQRNSLAIVVRYIAGNIPALEDLALPPILSELIMEKRGLILVVGATGSGKSTTMAAMLEYRNRNKSGHILTVEDPIEFLFKSKKSIVNQREVGIDTLSWSEALKNAMRQAPDCILIGEIRDKDTMSAAIAYAQTGHLCLATLHANNAYHAMNRIINFFPLESRASLYLDLAVTLKAIISQRLVKKPNGMRTPAVEILLNTRHIAELIEKGEIMAIKEAMEQSLAPGSQTFEQDLFRMIRDQIITMEEALANADSATNLSWLINNAQLGEPAKAAATNGASGEKATGGASFAEFTLKLDA